MAKRRLSGQQKQRIQGQQQARLVRSQERGSRTSAPSDDTGLGPEQPGQVVVNYGRVLVVEDGAGALHRCRARQNLGAIVCGDRVAWQPMRDTKGMVSALAPRRNALLRPDTRGVLRPVAANLDRIVLVIAARPPFAAAMIDRYLVAAEVTGIPAALLLNKVDLLDAHARHATERRLAEFTAIGYPLYRASTLHADGLVELTAALAEGTSILVGQSGVGKSSLVNALIPGHDVLVGALSQTSGQGTHTTTASTLHHLPGGGALIDSPGVWEFGPPVSDPLAVAHGYREFRPLLGGCQFANCRHLVEPGCAVAAAAAAGDISARRLESYRELYRTVAAAGA